MNESKVAEVLSKVREEVLSDPKIRKSLASLEKAAAAKAREALERMLEDLIPGTAFDFLAKPIADVVEGAFSALSATKAPELLGADTPAALPELETVAAPVAETTPPTSSRTVARERFTASRRFMARR